MNFFTAINCMDGRVQIPVIEYLQKRFDVEHIDSITAAGPNRILSDQKKNPVVESILSRVEISIKKHKSSGVAVIGHYDCAGNPEPEETQAGHTRTAVQFIREKYPESNVIGLWVDENWKVHEI